MINCLVGNYVLVSLMGPHPKKRIKPGLASSKQLNYPQRIDFLREILHTRVYQDGLNDAGYHSQPLIVPRDST